MPRPSQGVERKPRSCGRSFASASESPKGRRATPRRGVRLIAGGVTTGRRGYAPSPLRPGGAREKKWERRRSALGMTCTPPGCRGERGEGGLLRGLHPRLISAAPAGQWHEGVLHFLDISSSSTPFL